MSKPENVTSSSPDSNDWLRRCGKAVRILAGFECVLIAATWPLWWGQISFPAIPLINNAALPMMADRILVCILLAACIFVASSSGQRRWDRIVRAAGLTAALLLCISNQHRLQAWHWLFVLGWGASLFKPEQGLQLLRSILASVYVCSALSRMAPTVHQGMSAAIVDTLLVMFGLNPEAPDGRRGEVLCHALNVSELAVGVLLIVPKLRRSGILSAMLLHGSLLLALGPLGLGHHLGVLIWNTCFLCLIPVVFPGPVKGSPSLQTGQRRVFRAAMCFVWMFPLSGLVGIADNWPAWQLYSTRPETWTLQIHEADVHYLDKHVQPYVSPPVPLDDWVVVRIDRWSLDETESPLYPEDRFQCAVIRRVLASIPDGSGFRVDISEPQRWFWWKRTYRTLKTRSELDLEFQRSWLH